MRLNSAALGLVLLSAGICLGASPASARSSAQSAHCLQSAKGQGLSGAARTSFVRKCMKGPLAPGAPTAQAGRSKEAQAVTKPSGVDRTTRAKQCAAEADRKGLAAKDRSAFQLSCLATAGPVSEGQTGTKTPHPANQIKGIGVNNYKPSNASAKSTPAVAAPHP